MSSENFSNELVNGLTITNGTITETDTGPVDPFVGVSPITFGTYTEFAYSGIEWSGFNAGAVAPGSTLALDFQYTVSDTNPGLLITGLQDSFNGSGTNGFTSLTVTENVYSDAAHTHLIGSVSVNLSQESDPPVHAGDIPLSAGYQTVYVDLEVDAIVSASAPTGSQVTFSILDQGFSQSGITVDKEISVDGGTTWVDVGVGNITQDPTVLAGSNIEERVIVVNTGTSAISGASVIDFGRQWSGELHVRGQRDVLSCSGPGRHLRYRHYQRGTRLSAGHGDRVWNRHGCQPACHDRSRGLGQLHRRDL